MYIHFSISCYNVSHTVIGIRPSWFLSYFAMACQNTILSLILCPCFYSLPDFVMVCQILYYHPMMFIFMYLLVQPPSFAGTVCFCCPMLWSINFVVPVGYSQFFFLQTKKSNIVVGLWHLQCGLNPAIVSTLYSLGLNVHPSVCNNTWENLNF